MTIEDVAKKWEEVTDTSKARHLESIQEATMALVSSLDSLRTSAAEQNEIEGDTFCFDNRDVILYALGGKHVTWAV